ncbi:hypothetical protein JTB14_029447 [Gonioctena quinquepunctata]|nr:hypothetical protein JTB14_029447 [Gonioctena quinquepunctata]
MTRDQIAYARIRNRAATNHLQLELQRIEREKQNEMRTLDTEKRKFQTRCSRILLSSSNPKEVGDYSSYKRSPDQKTTPSVQSVDFSNLHRLVFTNGEVDAGKVLCLHLVSAHRAENLTPPKKKLMYMCKEHSPTERILEKSKRGYANNEKLSSLLPLYTIEFFEIGAMGESPFPPVINDGRLAARILINENIRELIGTVINALETSNKEKLRELSTIAKDHNALKSLLEKEDILDFMDFLREQPLVTNSESFLLTPPFKIKTREMSIRSTTGSLEKLMKSIRQTVLQMPTRKSLITTVEDQPGGTFWEPQENSTKGQARRRARKHSYVVSKSSNDTPKRSTSEERGTRKHYRGQVTPNFITKNIKDAAKVRRIEYDADDSDEVFKRKSSSHADKLKAKFNVPQVPSGGGGEEIAVNSPVEDSSRKLLGSARSSELEKNCVNMNNLKFHIKKIMCPACMDKWKKPLPLPKTPRVKESSVVPFGVPLLKTDSRIRLNVLIKREMYTLESYDKRYSADNNPVRTANMRKWEAPSIMNINFSTLDLAKIEQEIKEKETQKKLEKFLKSL